MANEHTAELTNGRAAGDRQLDVGRVDLWNSVPRDPATERSPPEGTDYRRTENVQYVRCISSVWHCYDPGQLEPL